MNKRLEVEEERGPNEAVERPIYLRPVLKKLGSMKEITNAMAAGTVSDGGAPPNFLTGGSG